VFLLLKAGLFKTSLASFGCFRKFLTTHICDINIIFALWRKVKRFLPHMANNNYMYMHREEFNRDEFSLLLKSLMEGKSILAFSKIVGIPQRTINHWINKEKTPSIENLMHLAKHFDCSIDYLVGLKDY